MSALGRITLPLTPMALALLTLAFALTGLSGHDPWKTEDAIGTGLVHRMLVHGQWLVPNLAGQPFAADGPLHYWVGAAFAWLASPWLALHDGARLASGAWVIALLYLVGATARHLSERTAGDGAHLALLGSLGLLARAHENFAEISMLAGIALTLYALARARSGARAAAPLLAAGIATVFLSKGLVAVLTPLAALLLLPAIGPDWRTRAAARSLAVGVAAAAAIASVWLAAARAWAPDALAAWWAWQSASLESPAAGALVQIVSTLSWSAWPAWPIALWMLWAHRRHLSGAPLALPVSALGGAMVPLAFVHEAHEVAVLPMLVPLALLAGVAIPTLRRGAANALAWFGAMSFGFFGLLVWLGWFAMMTGTPATIARNFAKLEPGFVPQFGPVAFAIAVLFSIAWVAVLARSERSALRGVLFWSSGATLLWALIMLLWLPWIDYGKTYRPVAQSLARAIPPGTRCIAGRGVGEPQRAAFDYHGGIVLLSEPESATGDPRCPLLLVQSGPDEEARPPAGWRRIWEGSRPRDRERYRLYARRP